MVLHRLKVTRAEAHDAGTVNLGVAADEIMLIGLESAVVLVAPFLAGAVVLLMENALDAPVAGVARQIIAALQHMHAQSAVFKGKSQRRAAHAGTDDEDVRCAVIHAGPHSSKSITNIPSTPPAQAATSRPPAALCRG